MTVVVVSDCGVIGGSFCRVLEDRGHSVLGVSCSLPIDSNVNVYANSKSDIFKNVALKSLLNSNDIDTFVDLIDDIIVNDNDGSSLSASIDAALKKIYVLLNYWRNMDEVRKESFAYIRAIPDDVFHIAEDSNCLKHNDNAYHPNLIAHAFIIRLLQSMHKNFAFPVSFVSFPNVYGDFVNENSLIGSIVKKASVKQSITISGDGKTVVDFINLNDLMRGLYLVMQLGKSGNAYYIDGCEQSSVLHLVNMICEIMDEIWTMKSKYSSLIKFTAYKENNSDAISKPSNDLNKTARKIGYMPLISLKDGIRSLVNWYKNDLELLRCRERTVN